MGRFAVTVLAVVGTAIGLLGVAIALALVVPVAVVLAAPLRLLGRQGTIRTERDGTFAITIDREAFRRG